MKRRSFRAFGSGEPARVIIHGHRQISRGRKPSMTFRNVRNPQEALKFAVLAMAIEPSLRPLRALWFDLEYIKPGVYQIDIAIGSTYYEGIDQLAEIAQRYHAGELRVGALSVDIGDITFQTEFNGAIVQVRHDSDLDALKRDAMRAANGYIDKKVGPYPKAQLSEEDRANDRRIEAEHEERYRLRQEEYRREREAKQAAFEAKLAVAPPFEVSDQEAWDEYKRKNDDREGGPLGPGYGVRIMSYAEEWARVMQAEMAAGKKLADIMEPTSFEASYDGISAAMYGAAVHVLSQCWVHGEELRRAHNLKHQIGDEGEHANDEGGTLDPAFIHVS